VPDGAAGAREAARSARHGGAQQSEPEPRPTGPVRDTGADAPFDSLAATIRFVADNVAYSLTTPEILELRTAGVSETVIQAMMRSGAPAAATSGIEVARKAEFSGLARVGKGFIVFGTSAKKTGRLVVDGENVTWFDAEDPKKNFSIYARNIKEVFNTCVLRPGKNLCLEFGFVTHTGEEYRFRDPGWKNGENRLVLEATTYFRQAFPSLFFSERAVSEL